MNADGRGWEPQEGDPRFWRGLLRDIEKAEAQLADGRGLSHDVARDQVLAALGGGAPSERRQ